MGSGSGIPSNIPNVQSLIDRAKEELRKGEEQGTRNAFISFAYEDVDMVNMLRAQAKNDNLPIEFNDWSVSEPIDSERAPYIKQKIAERIDRASVTVVFLSDHTKNSKWVKWEVEESIRRGKHVIGVHPKDAKPRKLPNVITSNNIKVVRWAKLADTIKELD